MSVDLQISTGQPWEATADVLVVPIVGDPDLSGPLGELGEHRLDDPGDREVGVDIATGHAVLQAQRGVVPDESEGAGAVVPTPPDRCRRERSGNG